MKKFVTVVAAALLSVSAPHPVPAAEAQVWTTWYLGPQGGIAVSTTDTEQEVIDALIARYGLVKVETSTDAPVVASGIKHIMLDAPSANVDTARGSGPTALNDCTSFASNPGAPFQITNANLPYVQNFNVTGAANLNNWRGTCTEGTSLGDGREAFVQFTPSVTGNYVVKGNFFRDATPATVRAGLIGVWELPGCTATQPLPTASTEIGCSLDLFGNSTFLAPLVAGTTYYVILEDNFGSSNEDTAHIEISGPVVAQSETCATALDLSASSWTSGFSTNGDTSGNNDQGDSVSDCAPVPGNDDYGPDFWVELPATVTGTSYTVDLTAGTLTDSVLTIYSGSCGTLTAVECNDDAEAGVDTMSTVTFTAAAGLTYYAQVESYHFAGLGQGTFSLSGAVATPPAGVAGWEAFE